MAAKPMTDLTERERWIIEFMAESCGEAGEFVEEAYDMVRLNAPPADIPALVWSNVPPRGKCNALYSPWDTLDPIHYVEFDANGFDESGQRAAEYGGGWWCLLPRMIKPAMPANSTPALPAIAKTPALDSRYMVRTAGDMRADSEGE